MGKATEEFDGKGRPKAKCEECGKFFHRLDVHVGTKHSMNVAQYLALHPGATILSELARERGGVGVKAVEKLLKRAEDASEGDTLNFGMAQLKVRKLSEEDAPFVPVHDEKWVPGAAEVSALEAFALGIQMDKNILIVGPPGIGKTSLVREVACMTNNPLRMVPITGDMRVASLLGSKDLSVEDASGQAVTNWTDGVYVDAAQRGHWTCFNEIDSIPSQVSFVLHSALENPRHLMVLGRDKNPHVVFHKRHRVVATANTLGYGDETGLFVGTGPMNEALLDRFDIVIRMGYPERAAEASMLVERTRLDASLAAKMVEVANSVRQAQQKQTTITSLSPRRLIAWAEMAVRMGRTRVLESASLTITNKLPPDDAKYVVGLIQRHFGKAP